MKSSTHFMTAIVHFSMAHGIHPIISLYYENHVGRTLVFPVCPNVYHSSLLATANENHLADQFVCDCDSFNLSNANSTFSRFRHYTNFSGKMCL
jgi:hypothetical protein